MPPTPSHKSTAHPAGPDGPEADEHFMREALRLARRGVGRTSPNPAVGCVIVRRGRVIGRGWHRAAGRPHAEIEALRSLPRPALARGATAYVTLEPCSTHGRTPPCTEALIAAGITRVVIGAVDPNPDHCGRAVRQLRRAGVDVRSGVLAGACAALNPAFNKWITTGLPLVIAKAGMSLDGRLTRPETEGRWITSAASRADAMRLRARVDAILVGSGTVRSDNPQLTLRGRLASRQPWRVIWSPRGTVPQHCTLRTDEHRERTLIMRQKSLRTVLRALGRRGVTSVLIEGGGHTLGAAFDGGLVDRVVFYVAPLLTGGRVPAVAGTGVVDPPHAARLTHVRYIRIGDDVRLDGEVLPPRKARHGKLKLT